MNDAPEYRALKPSEEDAAIQLWMDVMGKSREEATLAFHDFADAPNRFEHTFVAVAPDGSLLSAVQYWLRHIRGVDGEPQRVGHVLGMATQPEAQRQGHASRLLQMAVDAMRREGCQWSILFTRDEARSLYKRHGWRGFKKCWWQGAVVSAFDTPDHYVVRAFDPRSGGWDALAEIYAHGNARRPLTVLRNTAHWHGFVAWMLNDWMTNHGAVLLGAFDSASSQTLRGYAVANFHPPGFWISEIGALPEHEGAITALLASAADEQSRRNFAVQGGVEAPMDATTESALRMCFGDTLHPASDDAGLMAKALIVSDAELDTLFTAPGAHYWSLDGY